MVGNPQFKWFWYINFNVIFSNWANDNTKNLYLGKLFNYQFTFNLMWWSITDESQMSKFEVFASLALCLACHSWLWLFPIFCQLKTNSVITGKPWGDAWCWNNFKSSVLNFVKFLKSLSPLIAMERLTLHYSINRFALIVNRTKTRWFWRCGSLQERSQASLSFHSSRFGLSSVNMRAHPSTGGRSVAAVRGITEPWIFVMNMGSGS